MTDKEPVIYRGIDWADAFAQVVGFIVLAPTLLGFWELARSIFRWAREGIWFHPTAYQWLILHTWPIPYTEWRGIQSIIDWFFFLPLWGFGLLASVAVLFVGGVILGLIGAAIPRKYR